MSAENEPTDMSFFDNEGNYTDFALKLYGSGAPVGEFNQYLRNGFFMAVVDYVLGQNISNLCEKSSFCRLYEVYRFMTKTNLRTSEEVKNVVIDNFAHWLELLHAGYLSFCSRGGELINHIRGLVDGVDEDRGPINASVSARRGYLIITDFDGILQDLVAFEPGQMFMLAVIKGLKFRARGTSYSETRWATRSTIVRNAQDKKITSSLADVNENCIEHSWWDAVQYSSWARIKHTERAHSELGQFNYFFRFVLPCDTLVNGLAFANITFHHSFADNTRAGTSCITADGLIPSLNGEKNFACLNCVDSTALIVSAVDAVGLPVHKTSTYNSSSWNKSRDSIELSTTNVMSKLYFIVMYPERITYQYRGIEEDLDKTKSFEREL